MAQTGTCRPVCSGSDCVTVNQDRVDFNSAEETCRNRNGELLTFQSDTNERFLEIFSQGLYGNFWIGLQLPAGSCSNLSAPLRGYEWTSGSRDLIPLFNKWKDSVKVCSPHCVSVSNDQKWTERPCTEEIEGFLCKTDHKDACQAEGLSESGVFKSSKGCSDGPCEHDCVPVKDGYKCKCFRGYIPDGKNPRRCKMHCGKMKCPALCEGHSGSCDCPDGYILSEDFCEDMDECEDRGSCEENCTNTFGSFFCSCKKGFVVKDKGQCIKAADSEQFMTTTLPVITGFAKPASKNNTMTGSSAAAGGFIWMWIFIAVALVVFICVVRYYVVKRQKRTEQSSSQQTQARVDNNEC